MGSMVYRLKPGFGLIGLLRASILATAVMLLAGCRGHSEIVVGSKNFAEQEILGEILAQHIERKLGLTVERRFNLRGGTDIIHRALMQEEIDLYPEYTGTALSVILKEKSSGSPDEVYQRVKDEYHKRFAIEVTPRLGFNNGFVLVVRPDDAQQLDKQTISDLARHARLWHIAMGFEFFERSDGFPGLASAYGLQFAESPLTVHPESLYSSLNEKHWVVVGSSTDGLIQARKLVVLEDDKHYFPPYDAMVVVREDILARHAGLREALAELGGKITAQDIRRLNYAEDVEHRNVKQLATEFLHQKGL